MRLTWRAGLAALAAFTLTTSPTQGQPVRAADFEATLGVNTHIGSDPYNDPAKIASMLTYLGVQNVRQSSPIDGSSLANMLTLGGLGAKIDLIINGGGPVDLAGAMANVTQIAPYLNAVENVNEAVIYPISYKGLSGVDAAVSLQKDLYAAVRSNPALANVAVYIFTLGGVDPGAFPSIGDLSAYTDFANIHSYPPHGLRPIFVIHAAIDGGRTDAPSKPIVITETGYYTLPQNAAWGGVPEPMQASYLLGLVLDEAAAGVSRTYLYDLIDDGPDPQQTNREDHFGLFHYDGTPKVSATALHNLNALLADAQPDSRTFTPDNFAYTALGVPYNYTGNTMLFQKSNGTHIVAVWNEQQLWNPDTQTATPVQHLSVAVDLDKSYGTVLVYDPIAGPDAVQTLHDVAEVRLDLTDHPLLVVVPPSAVAPTPVPLPTPAPIPAPAPAPAPAPLPPPAPTAGNSLILTVSEDAWGGDAQYTIAVDGVRQGSVRVATASHAAGDSQTVTLDGAWGAGTHTVAVSFINDAWGGSQSTDRNLYVDHITLDGQNLSGAPASLFSNGTALFVTRSTPVNVDLMLQLAEDSWQGDAQYSVAVDGAAPTLLGTATAANARGASQAVHLQTALSAGVHDLALSFLNDAYGGAGADRNLYLKGLAVNGSAVPGGSASLFNTGTVHVPFLVSLS